MEKPIDKPIEAYLGELRARRLSDNTVRAYKLTLTTLNAYKPLNSIVKEDLIGFFNQFKGTDASYNLYAVITKAYFKSIGKPEISAWLKVKELNETLRADELLTAEDINKMIDATDSAYYKCLLALMYETGARIDSELLKLKYSDFILTDQGMQVTIDTKKTTAGFRVMLIPLSENYFINLRDSIAHKPNDIVFTVKYRQTFEVIKEISRRAHITKPCHPHAFRHARATELVRLGYNEAIIRKMLGWKPTSAMIARYQHLNDTDIKDAQTNGVNTAKRMQLKVVEKADIQPVYEALKNENEVLKSRLDDMENLIKRLVRNDHVRVDEVSDDGDVL